MEDSIQSFADQYASALENYLGGGGEAALSSAYELGRQALGYESGVLVVTEAHHKALQAVLARSSSYAGNLELIKSAADFLAECLSPFEMAQRGFHASIAALRDLNDAMNKQQQDLHLLLSPMPNLLLTVDQHDRLAALFVPPHFPRILKADKVGTPLAQVLPGEIERQVTPALSRVRQSEQVYRVECPYPVDGQTLYFDLQISPIAHSGDALLVIDNITERKSIQLAEHRQRVLAEALRDTAIALNSSLDLNEVLNLILSSIGRVVPHDTANVMLTNGYDARIVRSYGYEAHGLSEFERSITKLRISVEQTPVLYQAVESKQVIIIPDLSTYPGHTNLAPKGLPGSVISAPILLANTVIGLLNLISFTPHFFTSTHAENLQIFANQAAVAIQNARLFDQAQEAAALNERHRLARDLHDSVSQSLFSATIMAESLPRLWEREPEKAMERAKEVVILSRGVMAEMRTLLLELRPEAIVRAKLSELLKRLAEASQSHKRLDVQLHINEQDELLPPEVTIAFYRIAQECINNVLKHSEATALILTLKHEPDEVTLSVRDNGRGFDLQQESSGLGLGTMRERAEAAGAELRIDSSPGNGTGITVTWKPAVKAGAAEAG